jgi:chromate transporter
MADVYPIDTAWRIWQKQWLENNKRKMIVSLVNIFGTFFWIGLFTLGGGLAMSPVMRHELVIKRKWIKDADFISIMSLATVVPGAIAVNIAYLLGRRLRGKAGSAVAVLGTILPSFFVILFIACFLLPFFEHPKVAAFLRGCAIAIVGQLAFAGFVFGRKLLHGWKPLAVCAAGVIIVGVLGMHPIWGIIAATVLGFWLCPGSKPEGTRCNTNAD